MKPASDVRQDRLRDLLVAAMRYLQSRVEIGDVMTRNVVSVGPDTDLNDVARTMLERKIGGLPPGFLVLGQKLWLTAAIAGLVAWFIAVKEALDLEWMQTIIVVVVGWIVSFLVSAVAGIILGILGFTAAGIGGLFSQG